MWHSVLSKKAMRTLVASATASAAGIGAVAIIGTTVAYAGTTGTSSTSTSTTTTVTSTNTTSSSGTPTSTQQAEQNLQNQISQVYNALYMTQGVQAVQTAANQLQSATQDDWAYIIYGDSNGYSDLSAAQQQVVDAFQNVIPVIYEGLSQGTITQSDFQTIKSAIQTLNPNVTGADIAKLFGDFKAELEVNAIEALQSTTSQNISVTDLVLQSLNQAAGDNPVFAGTLSANGLSTADLPNIKQRLEEKLPSLKSAQQAIVLAAASTKLSTPSVFSLQSGDTSSVPLSLSANLSGLPPVTIPESDITWTSSNPSVAKINADDTVTAVASGTTTITAVVHGLEVQQFQLAVVGPLDHFLVEYGPGSGNIWVSAVDANDQTVPMNGTVYVKYDATEGAGESQDNDNDGWQVGTLTTSAGTSVTANNSELVPVQLSNGQADLSYTPSSETGTPDFDWVDTITFYQNSNGTGATGGIVHSGHEVTLDHSMPPGPIIAGRSNIPLRITPHDANGKLITGLQESDFKVTSDKVSTPLSIDNVYFDPNQNNYVVWVSDYTVGTQTLSVSVDGTPLKNTLPIDVHEAVANYGVTYDKSSGTLTIKALDKFGNIMTDQTTAYLNLYSGEQGGSPGDGDGDGFVPGQISGSQISSDNGTFMTVALTNGTATLNYTPAHEGSGGDSDWFDQINIFQSPWGPTGTASAGGAPFTYGPQQGPGGLVSLASTSDIIASGDGNVKLNVFVHDGMDNPVTGLTLKDFMVQSFGDYAGQQDVLDSVSPGAVNGEYVLTLTDTMAGPHQLQVFLQTAASITQGTTGDQMNPIGLSILVSGTANVVGTVTASDGTKMTQGDVYIVPVGTSNGQGYNAAIDPSTGTFSLNLPQGNYAVQTIADGTSGSSVQLAEPYPFTVTNTPVKLQLQQPAMGQLAGTIDVSGANGSLEMYPATATGQPDMTQPPIYLQIQNGQIQKLSVAVGTYYVTSGYLSTSSSNVANPYTIDQAVTITANQTAMPTLHVQPLSIGDPSTTVAGNEDYHQVTLSQPLATSDPVYMTVKVTLNGTPVTSGVSLQTVGSQGQNVPFAVSNGLFVADKSNPISVSQNTPLFLITKFQGPGTYELTYSLVDSQTNKPVVTGTKSIQVQAPNVSGTAYAADGATPVPYEVLFLQDQRGDMDVLQADQNGHFNGFLPAGTWSVTAVQGPSEPQQESIPQQQQTSFTITYGVTKTLDFSDPFLNVVGVAYEDGAQTKELANGGVAIVPVGGDQSQETWVPTDSKGRFALALKPGQTYTAVEEGNQDDYNRLNSSFTVSTSAPYTSVTVSPNRPDFQYKVEDISGALVTSGYVGIIKQSDYGNSSSNQKALWFKIHSDGTVSGYLSAGSYVAFAVSGQANYFPIDVPFTLQDTSTLDTSQTLKPDSGILSGTVEDQNGKPVANAAVVLMQVGGQSQQPIVFTTDSKGHFTSMGWNQQGQYTDLVQSGVQYQLQGIGTPDGNWVPGSQTSQAAPFTVQTGQNLTVQELGPDLTGTVSVDGTPIKSGWVAFGPAGQVDKTGQNWIWARISSANSPNGPSYSVSLPGGTAYAVYAIEDDTTGQYYDETGRQLDTPTVTQGTVTSFPITITNNFIGQVVGAGGNAVAHATLILGDVPNPTTQQEWNSVQYVTTDGQGNFAANVSGKNIYIVGIIEANGTYAQLGQEEPVGTGSSVTVDVAANVNGTLQWGKAPSGISDAWIVLQDANNPNQYYNARLQNTASNPWSFAFKLLAGTYNVVGVDLQQGSGVNSTDNWIDLTNTNQTITVPQTGGTQPTVTVDSQTGTISGLPTGDTGPGYVIFQNVQDSTKKLSVQFSSTGTFTTAINPQDWQAIGVETAQHYYTVSSSAQYGSSGWTLNIVN